MTIRRNVLALSVALLTAACSTRTVIQRSSDFLAEGYVLQAFEELERERVRQIQSGGEVDSDLQRIYDEVRFRYLIDRGREEIYADRELQGVATLRDALNLREGDQAALQLIDRAERKLAKRETVIGTDLMMKSDFEGAIAAFRRAQQFKPGFAAAVEGEASVQRSVSRLHAEAQKQFLEAIRKLPEFRYPEVDWHAQAALTRDPTRVDAADVKQRAMKELAKESRRRADQSREAKSYGAALMEYRAARDLSADLPGLEELIAQMEREVLSTWKTEQAQLEIRADRFAKARELLDEAFELSTLERTAINELRLQTSRRAGMTQYSAARDLELQGMKQESLLAFEAIAAEWPAGLDDEQTRIGAPKLDIDAAVKAYADGDEAEQKGELAIALDQFRTARTYYAKYRDVNQRIAQVEAKLAPPGGDGGSSGNSGS